MRSWLGRLLVLLGAFALVAAGVATFWGKSAAERTPLNTNTYTYLTGTASGVLAMQSDTPQPVKYLNWTRADKEHSTSDVVALVEQTCVVVDKDNPPACPPDVAPHKADPRVVNLDIKSFAVDRHTAYAVKDQKKYIPDSDTAYAGVIDKLPFHAKKTTYPYWNGYLGTTVDLTYVGEEVIDGLLTYEYDMAIPTTQNVVLKKAEKPGEKDTIGSYAATQKVWVDPKTGAFIDQEGTQTMKLPDGTVVLDIDVHYTDGTVKANVHKAKSNGRMLDLVTIGIPIAGLVLGIVLIAAGILLLRSGSRRRQRPEPQPALEDTPV